MGDVPPISVECLPVKIFSRREIAHSTRGMLHTSTFRHVNGCAVLPLTVSQSLGSGSKSPQPSPGESPTATATAILVAMLCCPFSMLHALWGQLLLCRWPGLMAAPGPSPTNLGSWVHQHGQAWMGPAEEDPTTPTSAFASGILEHWEASKAPHWISRFCPR